MADPASVVADARRIADDVLFPRALETDREDVVPRANLDGLADAGFYGLAGPSEAGGMGIGFPVAWDAIEALAGGCLTTTFVWIQHHGAVLAVSNAAAPVRDEWLEPLCRGERRAGVAFAGLLPEPLLRATRVDGGWVLDGSAPWVTGWGRIDVIHVAARDGDDIVWSLVDARQAETMAVRRLRLMSVDASATVTVDFRSTFVPDERVTTIHPLSLWAEREPATLRTNGSLALGLARRCTRLIGPGPLDDQLATCRATLDAATPETMPAARAAASAFALRAASTLVASAGARSIVMDHHGQRLAREALFLLVFGSRAPIRSALLDLLTRPPA